MNNCIVRIKESMESFSKKEAKLAKFILANPNEVANMTVNELAEKSKISNATVVRFCYSLGYDGFKDFSKSLYHDAQLSAASGYDKELIDDIPFENLNTNDVISSILKANIDAIQNSIKLLDVDNLTKAVNLIDSANKVYLYAIGGSSVVAEDAVFKFQRIGIDCQAYSTAHSQFLSASILNKGDVALFISYSGETIDIIKSCKIAKNSNANCISITRFGNNTLSNLCDVNLFHSSIGKGLRSNSTRSRIAQLSIIDIIFALLGQRRKEFLERFYQLTDEAFTETKI